MGVPDLRGSLGTPTFYTSDKNVRAHENESIVHMDALQGNTVKISLLGPLNPKTRCPVTALATIELERSKRHIVIRVDGQEQSVELCQGAWSDWLRVKFKIGLLQSVWGMVRFFLVRLDSELELYASPVNFVPDAPWFPISWPPQYAADLAGQIGTFHTTGMVEDHSGLANGRIDEAAFLEQCQLAWREREAMLLHELDRFEEGFLFCLFDTPDRIQHMFWRFREADHPAHATHGYRAAQLGDFAQVIEEQYRRCDRIVGHAGECTDDRTLLVALSDHGFGSFRRGVHLNAWLLRQGLLRLHDGVAPGPEAGDFLKHVDWDRTKAYALGLAGIFLNLQGREQQGSVARDEAPRLKRDIIRQLAALRDDQLQCDAVRRVVDRDRAYQGALVQEAPDLLVNFAAGYRTSWETALGGVPAGVFSNNTRRWSGDHIVDPELVPGVLLMNRPFRHRKPRLLDLAPTILDALGVPTAAAMEGESLLVGAKASIRNNVNTNVNTSASEVSS
jgi:predicted AlkP superfamily phosphohydrolase/phosphomutase